MRIGRLTGTYILFAWCLLYPGLTVAQTGSIGGTVIREDDGLPLSGVNVRVGQTNRGSATDTEGSFKIDGLQPGIYEIAASRVGFETITRQVRVSGRETTHVIIRLVERPIEVPEIFVERVTLTGGVANLPGSAHYITPRQLEKYSHSDINRILRDIPGVNLQEEDGFGLRPNIGMRGTGVERSSKITLMEDGVLVAPAPYADPAAYYFPTVGRMQGIEVRKGSSQIKYGPYTTGGALNLISTQIPYSFTGRAEIFGGSHDMRTIHASLGHSLKNAGFLLETYQNESHGFKQLDRGGDTGFDIKDYLAKVRINTANDARIYQAVTLKVGRVTQQSNETYLGLTDTDFQINPYRRYAASQLDVIDTEQQQYVVRHIIRPARFLDITSTLYRTEFSRNWYKLDRVRTSLASAPVSISTLLDDPDAHPAEYALLTGASGSVENILDVKANNRSYYAEGIESIVGIVLGSGPIKHEAELGFRFHRDAADRFQWVDLYRMESGVMELAETGLPGTESNRVDRADAVSAYAQYRLVHKGLTLTPGFRYENMVLTRDDYGKKDPDRVGTDLKTSRNRVDVFIPGIAVDYEVARNMNIFSGVHKGFAPPGPTEGTEPESSISYETGVRYHFSTFTASAVAFFSDYSNLLGNDLVASGGQGTSALYNGGSAHTAGVEVLANGNLGSFMGWRFSLPVRLAYTFTDAEFRNTFESEFEAWGDVQSGDKLPYIPRHQMAMGFGFEGKQWGVDLSAKYNSAMRTRAGQGSLSRKERTDSYFVIDLAAEYAPVQYATLFATVRNLTDEAYIVARRPAGLRPGLPRTMLLGMKLQF